MAKWFSALGKTRGGFSSALGKVFGAGGKIDETDIEDLEIALLKADVPAKLVMELVKRMEKGFKEKDGPARLQLAQLLIDRFGGDQGIKNWNAENREAGQPSVYLMIGVNGSGKTTTCAKLAWMSKNDGMRPILGATDTFRAAGSSQLKIWGDKLGVDAITGNQGADAASVAFDTLNAATARDATTVFIDTAGRMHNRGPLMDELKKMVGVIQKRMPSAPHHVWIVLDASIGQNAIQQARVFNEAVPLTGVVITKLDGSSKGGFLFSVWDELKVPVRFAGLGEGERDLVIFNPKDFVYALLGIEDEPPAQE